MKYAVEGDFLVVDDFIVVFMGIDRVSGLLFGVILTLNFLACRVNVVLLCVSFHGPAV